MTWCDSAVDKTSSVERVSGLNGSLTSRDRIASSVHV